MTKIPHIKEIKNGPRNKQRDNFIGVPEQGGKQAANLISYTEEGEQTKRKESGSCFLVVDQESREDQQWKSISSKSGRYVSSERENEHA